MRFVDASVFAHAYIKPKRPLKPHESEIKQNAKKIVTRISHGERVLTTVVHVGEIANILEDFLPLEDALALELGLLTMENVEVEDVSRELYLTAAAIATDKKLGLNDALAVAVMRKRKVAEIYSFDKDYDKVEGLMRVMG